MGFVPIQELEVAVDAKNKLISSYEFLIDKRNEELRIEKEKLHLEHSNFEVLSRNSKDIVSKLELEILTKERMNAGLLTELTLIKKLYDEAREENKETREMIYLRTGMKREVFAHSGVDDKEVAQDLLKSVATTRSGIKRQLEQRAELLLRKQKEKETEAITKGELPLEEPKGVIH